MRDTSDIFLPSYCEDLRARRNVLKSEILCYCICEVTVAVNCQKLVRVIGLINSVVIYTVPVCSVFTKKMVGNSRTQKRRICTFSLKYLSKCTGIFIIALFWILTFLEVVCVVCSSWLGYTTKTCYKCRKESVAVMENETKLLIYLKLELCRLYETKVYNSVTSTYLWFIPLNHTTQFP